ncbi:hypothetical protein [Hyphococcus sp.]|uniref:hypothetical protein n=1 Tax=Hyphococcus sp. TaxID=2038636 RepID=UPI0035C6A2B1
MTAITAPRQGRFYLSIIGGKEAAGRKQENIMGVVEIILIGFIGTNAALGLSSLFTANR